MQVIGYANIVQPRPSDPVNLKYCAAPLNRCWAHKTHCRDFHCGDFRTSTVCTLLHIHNVEQGLVDNTQTESSHRCRTQRALCTIERERVAQTEHKVYNVERVLLKLNAKTTMQRSKIGWFAQTVCKHKELYVQTQTMQTMGWFASTSRNCGTEIGWFAQDENSREFKAQCPLCTIIQRTNK